MTREEIVINAYFEWMCRLVHGSGFAKRGSYRKLLAYLHGIDFTYTIPMDGNRAEDGVDLRYRFGCEEGYKDLEVTSYLDNRPCSVLEMMVALAIRCEEHIMGDPDIGDRTGYWFWEMLSNLGLSHMPDRLFDAQRVGRVVKRFLERNYRQDGSGGLFHIHGFKGDLREAEIWYQMCWYLDEMLEG